MLASAVHTRAIVATLLLLCVAALCGCQKRATRADCKRVFDRIVALELSELGYRDKALLERRRAEVRRRFSDLMHRCVGRQKKPGMARCITEAKTAEQLAHSCL